MTTAVIAFTAAVWALPVAAKRFVAWAATIDCLAEFGDDA